MKKRTYLLEAERCNRLQELVFRIAAERSIRRHIGYEEAVSMGYMGLLRFLRRLHLRFDDEPHERRMAAQAIRWAITDQKRAEGPIARRQTYGGKIYRRRRYEDLTLTDIAQEDADGELLWPEIADWRASSLEGNDLWQAVENRLETAEVDRRIPRMIWMRVRGHTMKEIGTLFGISESRACQLFKKTMPVFETQILPLLQTS